MYRDYRVHLTPVPHTKAGNKGATVRCTRVSGLCYTSIKDVTEYLEREGRTYTVRKHGKPFTGEVDCDVVIFLSAKEFVRDDGTANIPCAVVLDGPLSLSTIKGIDILDLDGDPWESGARFTLPTKVPSLIEITERAAAVGGYHVLKVNNGLKALERATNGGLYQKIATMVYNHGDITTQGKIVGIVDRVLRDSLFETRESLITEIQSLSEECHPTRTTFIERAVDSLLSDYGRAVGKAYRYIPTDWEEDDETIEKDFNVENGDLSMLKSLMISFSVVHKGQ